MADITAPSTLMTAPKKTSSPKEFFERLYGSCDDSKKDVDSDQGDVIDVTTVKTEEVNNLNNNTRMLNKLEQHYNNTLNNFGLAQPGNPWASYLTGGGSSGGQLPPGMATNSFLFCLPLLNEMIGLP